ncbi:MAG TPA: LacI family DNA-binding transcriptional regulator [Anaerolineales bacterium]|jgi:DNA-binding LacI/PurR family transcriptional regulator|nr:LacI family DNA-binding transcriptional regulator [Anaerolineales bacterium]
MTKKSVRTIADIARLAGVSKSTVSRALNDSPLIGEETKAKIRSLAREHNFQINAPARRLSMQQSRTIAFVTHAYHKDFSVADLFGLEIMGGISSGLASREYDLLVIHVDPNDTKWARQYYDTGRVDGFILMTSTRKQIHVKALLELDAPFIIWGVPQPKQKYCSVTGDNITGGRLATEHLIRSGKQRIGFIGGPSFEIEVQHRLAGYEEALNEAGREIDHALIEHGDFSNTSGAEAMSRLLQKSPDLDAVFVNSDLMAIAAMDAIREEGHQVPEDIAVVGYDDLSIAAHSNPPLTTIRQNIPLAGKLLAQNLIEYLQTGMVTNVSIPVELIVRKSA